MLVFHSHCQMGNLMFIYACARSLARKRKLSYCLSSLKGLEAFQLSEDDKNNDLKFLWFRISNKIPGLKYTFYHLQDNREDYHSTMLKETKKQVWYYGYFQGENYLFDNHEDLKKCFSLKPEFKIPFEEKLKQLALTKETLVVHIRLRDYKTFGPDYLNGPDMTLPFDYYRALLKENYRPEKHSLIFLSDDIQSVKSEFSKEYSEAWFSDQSPLVDFQILMQAKTAIISHSSFAWWASYLNTQKDKRIIAPKYFLGFKVKKEYPVNMIPRGWEQKTVC